MAFLADIARQIIRSGRTLVRAPLFVACTAGTLATAMGLSAAVLAALDTLVFKPPPGVRNPQELVTVDISNYVDFSTVAAAASTVQVAARTTNPMLLQRGSETPSRVLVECVSGNYFSVLGVPVEGHGFDDTSASIVLSYRLWVEQFGAGRDTIGRSVRVAGKSLQIAGVAPQGFRGLDGDLIDGWIPIARNPEACSFTGSNVLTSSRTAWLLTIGRLRPGATIERARAELTTLGGRSEHIDKRWVVEPFESSWARSGRPDAVLARLLTLGAVALLLVACNNAALLLISRGYERQRENNIRRHLGASQLRLLLDVMIEGTWLSSLSLVGAVIVAIATWEVLTRILPTLSRETWLSSRAITILTGTAFVTVAVTLLAPCIQVIRAGTAPFTRIGTATASHRATARKSLIAVQFALALILAVGAHVFLKSLINVRTGLGYDIGNVLVASADFRGAGIRRDSAQRATLDEATDLLRQLPKISAVGLSSTAPLGTGRFTIVLPSLTTGGMNLERTVNFVSSEYFAAVGTPILQGRPFDARDTHGAPAVAIVDEGLARAEWPDRNLVGMCVNEIALDRAAGCVQIVGITARRRLRRLTVPVGEVFFPLSQGDAIVPQAIFIRPSVPLEQALPIVSAALRGRADLNVLTVRPLSDLVDAQARIWIVGSQMFTTLGHLAEVLAAIGIYGTLALSVKRRTPEIGIRGALGADPRRIASLVAKQAAAPLLIGWAVGLLSVLWTASLSQRYLFGVAPTDPSSVLSATFVLTLAGGAGALVPMLRAMRVSPADALRAGDSNA